jgi:energy-converting hydrogenase A subunit R
MSAGGPDPAAGGAAGAGQAPRRIYVTDCEGPLTRNDNAQEIAEHFIPDGAELFARLSKYDDFLADVVHKPGYNAGDTLRLLPPFLKAFEVTDDGVEAFSAEGVLVVPGAIKALTEIAALFPAFIISTSYTPYLKALCELSGFPLANVRCTELSLDAWLMPEDEKAWLREEAARVMERSLIEIPDEARCADDLAPADAVTVARLDDLFWAQMDGCVSGELVATVRPVGGGMKLAALEGIIAAEGVEGAGVMYVGDSITDAPPLAAVKTWGGVSLSFNGNGYALAAAEFAAASPDARVAAELAKAFAGGGRGGVEAAVRAWPQPKRGEKPTGRARARVGLVAEEPDALAEASAAARRSVRGERIARLG